MARNFSFKDLLNDESKKETVKTKTIVWVSIYDIEPHRHNFFRMDTNINGLKDSIREAGGVNNAVQIVRNGSGDDKTYTMYEGHRRLKSCIERVEQEGLEEFKFIKAEISERKHYVNEIEQIVTSNTTTRTLNSWEIMMSCMKLTMVYEEAKDRGELVLEPNETCIRDKVAHKVHLSSSHVGNHMYIGNHLSDELMDVFAEDKITLKLAFEAAHLEPDEQARLAEIAEECGTFTIEDIRRLVGDRVIPGQQALDMPTIGMNGDGGDDMPTIGKSCDEDDDMPTIGKSCDSGDDMPTIGKNLNAYEQESGECISESSDCEIEDYNTSESIVAVNYAKAGDTPVTDKFYYEQGEYELKMVDDLIAEYTSYRKTSLDKNDKKMIMRHCCILDGLKALRNYLDKKTCQ